MDAYAFDPLQDPRWNELVQRHPRASVFHTRAWLTALQRTYRFAPIAFTTAPPHAEMRSALVCAAVRSWATGARLISLPFSDHCEPLVETPDDLAVLCAAVLERRRREGWKYVELRPERTMAAPPEGFGSGRSFLLHRLDLRPDLGALWGGAHKASIQRKVRRAEREGLRYEEGRSEPLLQKLGHLLELTRERHGVPLQPLTWYRNLVECFGDTLSIRVASRGDEPAAALLTLTHAGTVVYKYGGSDARLHPLGGMPWLFWKTVQEAKSAGAEELDLGRSDHDNPGLATFKEHLGARRSILTYWRAPAAARRAAGDGWAGRLAQGAFARLPKGLRRAVGAYLYRHLA